jgi:hypothetical protein
MDRVAHESVLEPAGVGVPDVAQVVLAIVQLCRTKVTVGVSGAGHSIDTDPGARYRRPTAARETNRSLRSLVETRVR